MKYYWYCAHIIKNGLDRGQCEGVTDKHPFNWKYANTSYNGWNKVTIINWKEITEEEYFVFQTLFE